MTDMTLPSRIPPLHLALRSDAVLCAANGAAYLALAGPLGDLFDLAPALLRGAGAFLLVYAALVWLAKPRHAPAVVAANVGWVGASVAMAITGWGTPSTAGTVWIVLQALVVAAVAEWQVMALKRADG